MKKDNKGFSLVELIVVVLIMGILAVALTPQVLKWVNNSRLATDFGTMDTVASALQTSFTNENAYKDKANITITITDDGLTSQAEASVNTKLAEYLGTGTITKGTLNTEIKLKSDATAYITTDGNGKVSTVLVYNGTSMHSIND